MSKIVRVAKSLIKNPYQLYPYLGSRGLLNWLPDVAYLKGCFRANVGQKLDLKTPKTFNEKLQWLKLYDRKPEYTQMVDKYAVREYIKNTIGEEYLIPLLGVWDSFDEIDFDALPEQFVLKTNHDSGTVVICKDKKTFDIEAARKKINGRINYNYYHLWREWPYKNVKPRIIAEEYMFEAENAEALTDYKFFCFSGKPEIMYLSKDKAENPGTDFFDMEFNHLQIKMRDDNSAIMPSVPKKFDDMKHLAEILSQNIPHVRVDFYEINEKIYFGELTFYHCSGLQKITPESWAEKLGELIILPHKI